MSVRKLGFGLGLALIVLLPAFRKLLFAVLKLCKAILIFPAALLKLLLSVAELLLGVLLCSLQCVFSAVELPLLGVQGRLLLFKL